MPLPTLDVVWTLPVVPVDIGPAYVPESVKAGLTAVLGPAWLATYIFGIRRAWLDQRTPIPLLAVPFNVAWEFCFGFIFISRTPMVGVVAIRIWLLIDLIVVVAAFRFGWRDTAWISARSFRICYALIFPYAILFTYLMARELNDIDGAYGAFGLNMFMSFAFIVMLLRRGSTAGQTMYIGLAKLIGTAASSTLFALFFPARPMLFLLYITIFVLDCGYVVLLHRQFRIERRPAWRVV
jgi:hypothetical protein